jgi:hypothetical protein
MMRLLQLQGGELSLVEVVGEAPRYAILSHTWVHGEEVTFGEMMSGAGKSKSGYAKILFCGKQAARDGLRHFWVDTCCIDKSSSAELQEAINCMYRWYRDSARCYVYLADVSRAAFDRDSSVFRDSRWFTRGWTLQELIAPAMVEFFSHEGDRLGDLASLELHIREATGIPARALRGGSLHDFSVAERMAWAKGRETTREEDIAYSQLGIFDVQIPLIYGEGREKALRRLREEIERTLKGGWITGARVCSITCGDADQIRAQA